MIGRITGKLVQKQPPRVLLEVQGVGYEVDVPMSTFYGLPGLGETVALHTHLVVREDAHLLFGFATEAERHVFRQLLKISGVGPRLALAVLSGLSIDDLAQAISAQEADRLTRIPGVGKKTAERLVLELRDKLELGAGGTAGSATGASDRQDVANALLALGYNEREVDWAVRQLPSGLGISDSIRQALRLLSRNKD
jgi:holliday junction DNA helicase RuvA